VDLLEGLLPQEINTIVEESGDSLFPNPRSGLNATCSCPDKAVPCKHIAAVILYIARVLDYNPFLLLELKGKSKYEILNNLNLAHSNTTVKQKQVPEPNDEFEHSFNIPKKGIKQLLNEKNSLKKEDYSVNFTIKKPGKIIETLENLGVPQTIDNKAFEIVLRAIYQKVALDSYEKSLESEKL
jgi:uncharacterized Zn finger protein